MCGVYFTYVSTIIMSLLVWCLFHICQHFNYVTEDEGFISHQSALYATAGVEFSLHLSPN